MCWGDDAPEVSYEGPTESAKASLDIARAQRELYDTRFAPLEREYLQDINENLGGYAAGTAVADTQQAVHAAKQQAGPMLANRGQATGMAGTYASAAGAGKAAGVAQAEMLGQQAKVDRNMRALSNAQGLQSSISSTGQQMATQSTQAAITASNMALEKDLDRYQSNSMLMADLAGLGARAGGNYAMTGKLTGIGDDVDSSGFMGSSLKSPINRAFGG